MSSYAASTNLSPASVSSPQPSILAGSSDKPSSAGALKSQDSDFFGLVGPLSKKYCYLFYILSIVMLFFFFVAIIHLIKDIVMLKSEKRDFAYFFNATMIIVILGVKYIGFRLLFTICTNTL